MKTGIFKILEFNSISKGLLFLSTLFFFFFFFTALICCNELANSHFPIKVWRKSRGFQNLSAFFFYQVTTAGVKCFAAAVKHLPIYDRGFQEIIYLISTRNCMQGTAYEYHMEK